MYINKISNITLKEYIVYYFHIIVSPLSEFTIVVFLTF